MTYLIIIGILYLIGIFVAYSFTKKWEDKNNFEKIFFAILWPLTLILYFIHWLHEKL